MVSALRDGATHMLSYMAVEVSLVWHVQFLRCQTLLLAVSAPDRHYAQPSRRLLVLFAPQTFHV